ncbi:hypothetical protein ACIBK8_33250 [Streptomyces sp. NPDC050161]|uniref:hypothetical protein n=1 Tax=Streptomyces sp. NPDC050161 TaxID=3365604 RepID=UPI00378C3EFF
MAATAPPRPVAASARAGELPAPPTAFHPRRRAGPAVARGEVSEPLTWDHVSRDSRQPGATARPVPPDTPGARALAVCAHPVPGVHAEVTDPSGRPLAERTVGKICVRSPARMTGYWQDPEATAQVLRDGWLRTGDLGYRTPGGLAVCGRNLYPEDYEHVAARADGARQACAAFVVPDTERMVTAVEPERGTQDHAELAARVMALLREHLGHAPDKVVVLEAGSIPRTSSGKVQRRRCAERYFAGRLTVLAEQTR